jgi:hypothetical protein
MKKMNLMGPLFGLALMVSASFAAPDPNFHIYLAFGQSNMEGQGTIESQDKTVDPRFQMLSTIDNFKGRKLGTWNDAIPPLANNHGGLGPTDYFGRTLVEKLDPQIRVGVVVVAIAGCSIVAFDSPLDDGYMSTQADWFKEIVKDYGGDPYKRLVEMAKKAKEDGVIKGIIFHQGETDEGDSDWPNKVKKVYDRLVRDVGLSENIPFFAGEVPYQGSSKGTNNNIRKLPQQSKNFYLVSAEGLNDLDFMRIHFSSQGYRDFGKRYAEKVMEVLGDDLKPVAAAVESSSSEAAPESSSSEMESSSSGPTFVGVLQSQSRFIGKAVVNADKVSVPVALEKHPIVAKLFSMQGKAVLDFSNSYAGGTLGFSTANLPAGSYMLSVQVGNERSIQKVQIK